MKQLQTQFDTDFWNELMQHAHHLHFPAGSSLVEPNRFIHVIPILISGTVKVFRSDPDGHELFLYFIQAGDSCAVSLSACLSERPGYIRAEAEEDTELLAVPADLARTWMTLYPSWRQFVMSQVDKRFDELFHAIDMLAFDGLEERLKKWLLTHANARKTHLLDCTHQQIAEELSTSREVISRILKHFEKNQFLHLHRNRIEISTDWLKA